jgi:hypothetical protein
VTISSLITVVDALVHDLQMAVPGLGPDVVSDDRVHRYGAWSAEELTADGKRHLAVWPISEANEDEYLTNSAIELVQEFQIVVWESNLGVERLVDDEEGAKALLELQEDVKTRLRLSAQAFGGSYLSKYAAMTLDQSPSLTRGFVMTVTCRRAEALIGA